MSKARRAWTRAAHLVAELVDKRKAGLGLMASVEARERDEEKRTQRRELLGVDSNREFADSLAAKLLAARNT